jgi:hypothetical protein
VHHVAALEQLVEPDAPKEAVDKLLEQLRQEIAGEEDDQRAEQRWHDVAEYVREARLEALAEIHWDDLLRRAVMARMKKLVTRLGGASRDRE